HLRIYYYRTRDIAGFARAREAVRTEVLSHGLKPTDRVLDIGSGIGNLALALIDAHTGTYDGVEIHPEAVAWCRSAIASRRPGLAQLHAVPGRRGVAARAPARRAAPRGCGRPGRGVRLARVRRGGAADSDHPLRRLVERPRRRSGRDDGECGVTSFFALRA